MITYADAYHQARRCKDGGYTAADLERQAVRYDSEGKHGAAAAYRAVAAE
ncbi:hypothetical protein [Nonomuraea typhae]|uniref:Uncharacterized protein n=1 Tax=Nonomuraea typhae TaxID=2603600 RepID=A0ABW7YNS7_9ACTN